MTDELSHELVERVVLAIHEGLGGNGWAYSDYGHDEMNTKRRQLVCAAKAAISVAQQHDIGYRSLAERLLAVENQLTHLEIALDIECKRRQSLELWVDRLDRKTPTT